MRQTDKDILQDIIDDLLDRMVGALIDSKKVTLPEPIRVVPHGRERP